MKAQVRDALITTGEGFSPDRVIADPRLNAAFLAKCRELGLQATPSELNQCLMNLRKSGDLKGLPRSRKTSFPDQDQYQFASEVAARFLERKHGVSLDRILCDPDLVQELDSLAAELGPGHSVLQYRWAALSLRKARKLKPELVARVAPTTPQFLGVIDQLDPSTITTEQGLYIFHDPQVQATLYVGEAQNLRKRLEKHLDHSDNKSLARWLWEHGGGTICLEIHLLSKETEPKVRKALEAELIDKRHPRFNIQQKP